MRRNDAKSLLALIDKDEQIERMLDDRLSMGGTRAFVVAGCHEEWPEALAQKLAYTLDRDNFTELQPLQLNMGIRPPIKQAPNILLRSLAKYYPYPRQPDSEDISIWLAKLPSQVFYLPIYPNRSPSAGFIARLVEAWESILANTGAGACHYLLVVLTSRTSSILPPLRWRRRFALWWLAYRVKKSLGDKPERILPSLKSLDSDHVLKWCVEHSPEEERVDWLLSLFDKRSAIPHRELLRYWNTANHPHCRQSL